MINYSLRYVYKRVWIIVVWSDETVAFGFAKIFYFPSCLWILESQSRSKDKILTKTKKNRIIILNDCITQ